MATLFTATMFNVERIARGARNVMRTESMLAAKEYIVAELAKDLIWGGVFHREHATALFNEALAAKRKVAFVDGLESAILDNKLTAVDFAVRVSGKVGDKEIEFGRADVTSMPKVGDVIAVHDLMNNKYFEGVTITSIMED